MIREIWDSVWRLPLWVILWVCVILVPVNLASLAFWFEPYGMAVALLAVGGMAPNLVVMAVERGVSRMMSLPHLVVWIPLVCLLVWLLAFAEGVSAGQRQFLYLLLVVDVISLGFDIKDGWRWWKGEREIA